MPSWLLDKNVQGVVALLFIVVAAIWAVFKWAVSSRNEAPVTKLEIQYPSERIEERLTKIEGMCIQILDQVQGEDEQLDETGRIARFLLDRCKLPDARVHEKGMEIDLTVRDIHMATYIEESLVSSVLVTLEEEGLIMATENKIVVNVAR
jgi:hypothetical protein